MPKLLHILTDSDDSLAMKIIAKQKANPASQIDTVDLSKADADYKKLLEQIFAADSVQVW